MRCYNDFHAYSLFFELTKKRDSQGPLYILRAPFERRMFWFVSLVQRMLRSAFDQRCEQDSVMTVTVVADSVCFFFVISIRVLFQGSALMNYRLPIV